MGYPDRTRVLRRRFARRRWVLMSGLALLLWLLAAGPSVPRVVAPLPLRGSPVVRVRLSATGDLSVSGPYEVRAATPRGPAAEVLARGEQLAPGALVEAGPGRWTLDGNELAAPWIELAPARDGSLRLGTTGYRGRLLLGRHQGELLRVNAVPIEHYLAGVLGAEMPLDWHEQALLSQAVAARTYALYELSRASQAVPYDVRDTVASQVYRGLVSETSRARELVGRTQGQVLEWADQPLHAFFHSTCGGRTANAARVFGSPDITPLAGSPCAACGASPWHRWSRRVTREELSRRLGATGRHPGAVQDVQVVYAGGRAERVRVVGAARAVALSGDELRRALGTGEQGLLSTAFQVRVEGDEVRFDGAGWGHGVGLCQYGAQGMALGGALARDILSHYYPGAALVRRW